MSYWVFGVGSLWSLGWDIDGTIGPPHRDVRLCYHVGLLLAFSFPVTLKACEDTMTKRENSPLIASVAPKRNTVDGLSVITPAFDASRRTVVGGSGEVVHDDCRHLGAEVGAAAGLR